MRKIKWIHFSDLHLNVDGVETKRLRKQLIEYLRGLNLHCDYAFFTGDVRDAPSGAFPDNASEYLVSVCNAVNTPVERLFVVPGNHDVDRAYPGRMAAIRHLFYRNSGYYEPMEGSIKANDLQAISEGQQAFRQFLSKLYRDVPGRDQLYIDDQHPHFCITTDDLNIVHIDSTITYAKGQERDLIVGTAPLMEALEKCVPDKPVFLLTHYSYDYLHRNEQNQIFQLLQDYHVQVWIAGHEHDHLCRPQRGYFQELQSGNLVLQNGARSCVLIGEMDLDTGDAVVRAHAWYPQGGWAVYPFIRTGTEDNAIYPFSLTLSEHETGLSVSIEERNILEVCRTLENAGGPFYGVTLHRELLPDLRWNSKVFQNKDKNNPLLEAIQSLCEQRQRDRSLSWHALLLGDGGMGKSTMLFYSCKRLVQEHRLAVYVSLNMLQGEKLEIERKILRTLYGAEDDSARNKFVRLLSEAGTRPNLILLMDGFNELNGDSSYRYASELKQLAMYPGIQIIVSSRLDFLRYYGMSHFQMLQTCDLRDGQIEKLFIEPKVWQDILSRRDLHILLKNPMMALLYAQTSPIIERYKELDYCEWKLPICNASDLLHNFYMAQVALALERGSDGGNSVYAGYGAIKYVLPYLAWQAEAANQMAWSYNDFEKAFAEAVGDGNKRVFGGDILPENLLRIKQCYRVPVTEGLPRDQMENAIISELCLLRDNGSGYAFSHQIYRDYLAAVYLSEELMASADVSELWKTKLIHDGVVQYLQYIHGDLWGNEGLLTEKLIPYRGIDIPDGDYYVENLLNCWLSENRDRDDVRDLSMLDLRKISLTKHLKQRYRGTILLEGAKLSKRTFVNEQRHDRIIDLAFSHDGRMLAAVSANGIVSVCNILTQSQMIVGKMELGRETSLHYTAEDYLFLKTDDKYYKWPTISYDKIVRADEADIPLCLQQNTDEKEPANVLYKMLKDSDMLGSKALISDQRTYIAVGCHSGLIQIWNVEDQTIAAELTLGDGQVVTASFTPNGEIAAIGAGGNIVQLWSIKAGRCRGVIHFEKQVRRVRFPAAVDFRKNPYLECEYSDGHCYRVNISTGGFEEFKVNQEALKIQKRLRARLPHESIKKIDVASNNNAVILLNNSKNVYVWNNATQALNLCTGHEEKVQYAEICHADPRYAASYSGERIRARRKSDRKLDGQRVIRAWAIRKGNCMQRLPVKNRTIQHIQFFTTNRIILAGFAANGDIMLWELVNKMEHGEERGHWNLIDIVRNHLGEPLECAISTHEKLFIGVNADGTLFSRSFSGEEKSRLRVLPGIDLTPLRWENLQCDEELITILQTYKK